MKAVLIISLICFFGFIHSLHLKGNSYSTGKGKEISATSQEQIQSKGNNIEQVQSNEMIQSKDNNVIQDQSQSVIESKGDKIIQEQPS